MSSLVEIPRNKWIQLRDLYKTVWPEGVVAYCVLDTQIADPTLSNIMNFKVYCPEGDINNGMVAIVDLLEINHYHVLIHPVTDIVKIEEALQATNIVNWGKGLYVPSANLQVIECLKKLQRRIEFNMKYADKAYKYILDDNAALYDLSVRPPDTYVAPLRPEYIYLINKTWKYHNEKTNKFFEILMNQDLTYVLYSNKDDKPVAWVTINAEGALSHLYTLEPYRRRGYGEFITKYAANDIRRKGKKVLAYTVEDNVKPRLMFEKLGFRTVGIDQWIFIH